MVKALAARDTGENLRFFRGAIRRDEHQHRLAHNFLRRETEELLRTAIPTGDGAFQGFADDRVIGGLDDGGEMRAHCLHSLRLGDVTHETGEGWRVLRADAGDGQFDRELRAIGAQGGQFQSLAEHRALRRGEEMRQTVLMLLAQGRRDDDPGHFPAQHLVRGVTKDSLRGGIEFEDPPQVIDADDAVQGRIQNGPLAGFALPQGAIPLLDMIEHLIECVGQQAQFVLADFPGADGIVFASGDGLGDIGQRQDRLGNAFLQHGGDGESHQEGNRHDQDDNAAVELEPPIHGGQIVFEIERAQSPSIFADRLGQEDARSVETIAILPGRGGQGAGGLNPGIAGKQFSVTPIKAGSHHIRFGSQGGEDGFGVIHIFKSQRCRGVVCGDLSQCRQILDHAVPERDQLVRDERAAGQQQHRAAGQQDDRHEFSPDGLVLKSHLLAPSVPTSSAARSTFELIVRRAALAASVLIRS